MKTISAFIFIIIFNYASAQSLLWAKDVNADALYIAKDTAGSVYTLGNFYGVVDFDPGTGIDTLGTSGNINFNLFISKTDVIGNYVSARSVIVSSGQGYVSPSAIKIDTSGNIYVTGTYLTYLGSTIDFDPGPGTYTVTSFSNQQVCFVLKLDAGGNFLWVKSLEGSGARSNGDAIATDALGNVVVAGHYLGTVDFDPGIPTYTLNASSPTYHSFILELDASGNFVWVKEIYGTDDVLINAMTLDGFGNMYFAGQYQATIDFDPGASTYTLTSAGADDIFTLKLDGSGNLVWVKSQGGTGSNIATAIAVDALGNSHLTGTSGGVTDFDPGAGTYTLAPIGTVDIFTSKLDALGNFVWAKTVGNSSTWMDGGKSIDVDKWGNVYTVGTLMVP